MTTGHVKNIKPECKTFYVTKSVHEYRHTTSLTVGFYLYELSGVGKLREPESRLAVTRGWEKGVRNCLIRRRV